MIGITQKRITQDNDCYHFVLFLMLCSSQSGNLRHKLVTCFFTSWILMTFPGCGLVHSSKHTSTIYFFHGQKSTKAPAWARPTLWNQLPVVPLGYVWGSPGALETKIWQRRCSQVSVFLPSGRSHAEKAGKARVSPESKAPAPRPEPLLEACSRRCGPGYSSCGKGAGGTAQENTDNLSGFFV